MKTKIIFLLFILCGIYSCRKDSSVTPVTPAAPHPTPTIADYRDTILGHYTGTMHRTNNAGLDTTYTTTLAVTIDTTNSNYIRVYGYLLVLDSNYSMTDSPIGYHPHSGADGSFTFYNDSTHIEFHTYTGYGNYVADEQFYGRK